MIMIQQLDWKIKNPIALLCLFAILSVSSCKSDKKDINLADAFDGPDVINFTVNTMQLPKKDRLGLDVSMDVYKEDRANKEHVLHVDIFDTIYLKDISQFAKEPSGKRRWYVDGEELPSNEREVTFYSEEVGPSIVILKYNDNTNVSKGIYFSDQTDMSTPFAEEEVEPMEEVEEMTEMDAEDVMTNEDVYASTDPEPAAQSSYSKPSSSTSYNSKPATQSKTTSTASKSTTNYTSSTTQQASVPKPAPKKVEVERVDFSVSKTIVEEGETISFKDMSVPAEAVKNQVWDWGDGNTMSVRRGGVKYSYLKAGTYNVKLCLNYSSKCKTKTITVKEGKKPVIAPVVVKKEEPKKEEPKKEEVKKPTVSKVSISSASKTLVGKPIEIRDETYPAEAVESREWFINGVKSNLTNRRFSKTFDKAGKYTLKLCVNGGSALCESKVITVEEKPKPKPEPVKEVVTKTETSSATKTTAPTTEFFAMDASRSGLRSSQRCPDSEAEFHSGVTEITLNPKVRMELMNARIYGQKVALAKVTLKAADGSITRKINNVQILPGPSTIEFGDFGVILQAGKTYTLIVEPMSSTEQVALENGGTCNTTFASDDRLAVKYKDNVMTLFDIKFGFE